MRMSDKIDAIMTHNFLRRCSSYVQREFICHLLLDDSQESQFPPRSQTLSANVSASVFLLMCPAPCPEQIILSQLIIPSRWHALSRHGQWLIPVTRNRAKDVDARATARPTDTIKSSSFFASRDRRVMNSRIRDRRVTPLAFICFVFLFPDPRRRCCQLLARSITLNKN